MNTTESFLVGASAHDALPAGFLWGVATSAFQIEGAARADGKGESIWDRFCHVPGAIADGSNGDVACDHVARLESDLDLIAQLGVDAYRFSVSWPRVQPGGRGPWSPRGLDFYERLVDGLVSRGIRPCLTLNHWDLPAELQDEGGWANRSTVDRFVEYAQGIERRLGDRLAAITTHNEPWVIAMLGHESGVFAPGLRDRRTAMQVSHHLLLSHGLALRALRAQGARAPLGIVLNLSPVYPSAPGAAHEARARLEDGLLLRWYMDALFGRGYPEDVLAHLATDAPQVLEGDLEAIAQPLDYLGVNYYTRCMVGADGPWDPRRGGLELTDMGWEIYPRGLTELLERMHRDYPLPPVHVTENGAAFADEVVDGRVHDPARIGYLAAHIQAMAEAARNGVPVAGYMVWSLFDNFEWSSGYARRFGVIHVDYETQRRTLKDSALWYRDFLARRSRAQGAARPPREG